MKKLLLGLSFLLVTTAAYASPFGDFNNKVTGANLKPFALDLGGLLGSSAFHSGRSIGFPGFDVDVIGVTQFRPDKDDSLLRGSGVGSFGLPLVQAAVALPGKIDVIAHGTSGYGARVYGGGVRYGLLRSGTLDPLPDLSISGFFDKVNQTYFNAEHYSVNAAASWALPIIHPYAGVGWDLTRVEVGSVANPILNGTHAWARGTRLSGGLELSPLPFVHVFGAYTLRHRESGLDFGLGVRF